MGPEKQACFLWARKTGAPLPRKLGEGFRSCGRKRGAVIIKENGFINNTLPWGNSELKQTVLQME